MIAQTYDFRVVATVIPGPTLTLGALWLSGFAGLLGLLWVGVWCPWD
jgi:hypothetical protein|tara:strand:- start:42 stop:182 length:141 start_codon:yes stop_codon:yes gene_type:complete